MSTKKAERKKGNGAKKKSHGKGADNRHTQRVPVQLLVDYRCGGHYLFDFCRDLGTGGVFIQTDKPLSSGSSVDLTFTLPDSKETLVAKGKVIWVQNEVPGRDLIPGMGVQFDTFSPEQRQLLEDFVERYHGQKNIEDASGKTA